MAATATMGPVGGPVDYAGQALAETVYQRVIVAGTVLAFVGGFALQDIMWTVYIFGAALLLAVVAVVPPWPIYSRNPLAFQKPPPPPPADEPTEATAPDADDKKKD